MLSIQEIIVQRHFNNCSLIAARILSDPSHPLYPSLSECKSLRPMRRLCRSMPTRMAEYRNSVIPYLSRFVVSLEQVKQELKDNFHI